MKKAELLSKLIETAEFAIQSYPNDEKARSQLFVACLPGALRYLAKIEEEEHKSFQTMLNRVWLPDGSAA